LSVQSGYMRCLLQIGYRPKIARPGFYKWAKHMIDVLITAFALKTLLVHATLLLILIVIIGCIPSNVNWLALFQSRLNWLIYFPGLP
jgi:hypothetical protein